MPSIIRIRNLVKETDANFISGVTFPIDHNDYVDNAKRIDISDLKNYILSGFTGGGTTGTTSGTSGINGVDGVDGIDGTSGISPCLTLTSNSIKIVIITGTTTTTTTTTTPAPTTTTTTTPAGTTTTTTTPGSTTTTSTTTPGSTTTTTTTSSTTTTTTTSTTTTTTTTPPPTTTTTTTLPMTQYCYTPTYTCDDTSHVPPGGTITWYDQYGAPVTESGYCNNGTDPVYTWSSSQPPIVAGLTSVPCGGTTTTTTTPAPTTTTTTTIAQVYYSLQKCSDSSNWETGPVNVGTYSSGQRVEGATSVFYQVVTSSSTTFGYSNISVTYTGQMGCP